MAQHTVISSLTQDRTWLQQYLRRFGYLEPEDAERSFSELAVDDTRLREAISRYQQLRRLPVTGELDEATASTMQRRRCGNPDLQFSATERVFTTAAALATWPTRRITFSLDRADAPPFPQATLDQVVAQAFAIWAGAFPFDFVAVFIGNIFIGFRRGDHGDNVPDSTFDQMPGGIFGHGYGPDHLTLAGQAHLDAAEDWFLHPGDEGSADLMTILAHEIGHSLGLPHEFDDPASIMAADFGFAEIRRTLSAGDVQRIRTLYQNVP